MLITLVKPVNNLQPGQICTLVGPPGMGSGRQGNDILFSLKPDHLHPHPTGGWFISDINYHTVWFYNTTGSSKTVLGLDIAAGEARVVAGTGRLGVGTEGQNARKFFISGILEVWPIQALGSFISLPQEIIVSYELLQ
jgi:hypothetical protein